jgi:hypothetical protein
MALIGNERLEVLGLDSSGRLAATTRNVSVNDFATVHGLQSVYTTNTATAATTLTAANISGASHSVVLNLTGTLTAAAIATLPTVSLLVAADPSLVSGTSYVLRVINSSSGAYAWTVAVGSGFTLTGTATVAQNTWREFIITMTSSSAATIQSVGTGTYS